MKEILVALPDDRRRERRRILKDLQDQPVEVKVLPAVEDIASGRISVTDLRPSRSTICSAATRFRPTSICWRARRAASPC